MMKNKSDVVDMAAISWTGDAVDHIGPCHEFSRRMVRFHGKLMICGCDLKHRENKKAREGLPEN